MKKVMGLWDIVFINITGILVIRWLPMAADYGAASILMWVAAVALFFVPLGLVSTELATAWPDQGGMYVWVREAFGKKAGFMVSWFYWTNNFFFYPAVLAFIAIIMASVISPTLVQNKMFIYSFIICFLWIITFINMRGMRVFKMISNLAGIFGVVLPMVVLIVLGFGSVIFWDRPIATDYSWSNLIPDFGSKSSLSFLAILMFSMAGIELTPIMAGETKDPQKTFPRATLISAFFIVGLYIISTAAITFVLPPDQINPSSGIIDVLIVLSKELNIPFLAAVVGGMIVFGSIGNIGVWIVAPIKMLLESCRDGALPKWFTQTNKDNMPVNALLIQACIVTLIVIGMAFLTPSVDAFFATAALIATITYFIPYIAMFLTFFRLRIKHPQRHRPYRVPGNNIVGYLIAAVGLSAVLMGILFAFISPPNDIKTPCDIMLYRLQIGATPIIFAAVGYFIYSLFERKQRNGG